MAETETRHKLTGVFSPRSVVLVGASDKSAWSHLIFRNFAGYGFDGAIYMVNKRGVPAHGIAGTTSCAGLPERPDIAYIFVPLDGVLEAFEDAAAAGIKAVVVLTSGFAETGETGAELQARLVRRAVDTGVTLIGPNSLGFVNIAARAPVSSIPAQTPLLPGSVALACQSGATTSELYEFAQQQNIGLNFIIATGNEAQVDLAQIVEYLVDDPETRAIAVFAEAIRDPARFVAAAERARTARKPIVILKVGKSALSAEVAKAHTGSLVGDDRAFDAACRRYGVIRVESAEDLILTAGLLAATGPIERPGVAIASISGGACTLIADRAEEAGLSLPALAPQTVDALRQVLPDYGSTLNPLDITGAAIRDASLFEQTIAITARDPAVGLVGVVMAVPNIPGGGIPEALASIGRGARAAKVPSVVVTTALKPFNEHTRQAMVEYDLPFVMGGVDHAVRAFGKASWWSEQLHHEAGPLGGAAKIVPARPQSERETLDYLSGFGVPVIPARLVATADQAVQAAAAFGGAVVLKVASPHIAHKTDIGGVRLGLGNARAVAEAFNEIEANVRRARPEARIDGIIVSPMREHGLELFVGAARDPQWGPVLALGLGGVWVEALADTALTLLPVQHDEVVAMLESLRGSRLLKGFRGAPPVDLDTVAEIIVRIGNAVLALGPDLAALEINPLWTDGARVEALDALAVWSGR